VFCSIHQSKYDQVQDYFQRYPPHQYIKSASIQHMFDARTNYYRGFRTWLVTVNICLYTKLYGSQVKSLNFNLVGVILSNVIHLLSHISSWLVSLYCHITSYGLCVCHFLWSCFSSGGENVPGLPQTSNFSQQQPSMCSYSSLLAAKALMFSELLRDDDPPTHFVLDNDATRTYVCNLSLLTNINRCNGGLQSANGQKSSATYIGTISLLPIVMYSEDMAINLLSQ
jgi:hypothetical protein